jgi:Gas vesicle synthesis protein GvpO
MPERRTARTGRRAPVRKRPRRDDERADEELEPDGDPADEEPQPAGEEPADDDEPVRDEELADGEPEPADEELADEEPEPADEELADEEPAEEEQESADEEPEAADERDAPRRRASRGHNRDGGMSAAQAARSGLRGLADLIGKRPEGITSVEPTDDGWRVGVEVVEDRRVPSTADILAIYEATLDADGTLVSYRRVRRYARGRSDDGEG